MSRKTHLALIGPMGAGKSSIGRALAARLDRRFVDLDREIEVQAGADISLIFEIEGEAGFRRRERDLLANHLADVDSVIACGGGVVLDADNRRGLRSGAFVVYLVASVEEQLARLARDRSRPLLQTADRRARLETLAAQRDSFYTETADLSFHPGGMTTSCAAREIAERVRAAWPDAGADSHG